MTASDPDARSNFTLASGGPSTHDHSPDGADNCPLDANADQADTDGDGAGDVCDADLDGDGVTDGDDACVPTASGEVVNAQGCSIADLCPCDNDWRNHGAYVVCTVKAANLFFQQGLISRAERRTIGLEAARSQCGKKHKKK